MKGPNYTDTKKFGEIVHFLRESILFTVYPNAAVNNIYLDKCLELNLHQWILFLFIHLTSQIH
jgi:hypothetical protein